MSASAQNSGAAPVSQAPHAMGSPVTRDHLDWDIDGRDWPNRASSRFVVSSGRTWHVQMMGSGPTLLLLHGTGASVHSWRDVLPLLAQHYHVIALDLPGHAFTDLPPPSGLTMDGMSRSIAQLLSDLGVAPKLAIGHSAGAAILVRMQIDKLMRFDRIVSLNGALRPLLGVANMLMPTLARIVASAPFVPDVLAWRATSPEAVARLLNSTGSHLNANGIAIYRHLFSTRRHVTAALGMMANWDLHQLWRDLPRLDGPLDLVATSEDLTIPATQAWDVKARVPHAVVHLVRGLGHLAHEERPQQMSTLIQDLLDVRDTGSRPA